MQSSRGPSKVPRAATCPEQRALHPDEGHTAGILCCVMSDPCCITRIDCMLGRGSFTGSTSQGEMRSGDMCHNGDYICNAEHLLCTVCTAGFAAAHGMPCSCTASHVLLISRLLPPRSWMQQHVWRKLLTSPNKTMRYCARQMQVNCHLHRQMELLAHPTPNDTFTFSSPHVCTSFPRPAATALSNAWGWKEGCILFGKVCFDGPISLIQHAQAEREQQRTRDGPTTLLV